MTKKYQVVGIGNAMVDVLTHAEDSFLAENGVEKGIMQLIDMERAVELYSHMGPGQQISGGSGANTIAGIAGLGGRAAYVGKVKDDQLGEIFAHDMRALGAAYETPLMDAQSALETGRCMIIVTPDGERSMNTYLGVSEFLTPEDIDETMMADAEWIYLEGYRFDGPDSHAAFAKAIAACKGAGGKVSITLSDPFCVERHRDAFRSVIKSDVDLLFCNRAEMLSMYETDDFDAALAMAASEVEIVACTDSDNGAHILAGGERYHALAVPTDIVDATGAGDLFAGAFLWGLTNGHDVETCGKMGCVAASEVISHIGARAETNLLSLFEKHGLL
ncbi:adenosine kinase [Cochlodiniinecator piscidefendens]|uniref:adenosine kinase n=1 Tax=Cochlodiniinecator piscidefendens TaxID=2715756 RepID=UPI00140E2AFF|nr:adenosine kinase [Cochlodiniinecator piscidefendens]